jgi:PAS domain S-box-containing protein
VTDRKTDRTPRPALSSPDPHLAASGEPAGHHRLSSRDPRSDERELARLRSVFASLGDAVIVVDRAGRIVASNEAYERTFGGDQSEIKPQDVAGIPLQLKEQPRQRAARGERFRMEFAMTATDGSRRWFEAVAAPLSSRDPSWSGIIAIRDVSDRTMRLSLERLMASAGHELKTPMAALHGYLQLMDRSIKSKEPPDLAVFVGRALAQTRRMGELVERLFDASRIQRGQLELIVEPFDLVAVVRGAIEASEGLPGAPPIRLREAPRRFRLVGDAGRLEQVFVNLVGNAVQHAEGTPTIDVSIRRARTRAIVAVSDRGPGIAAEELPLVFQPYVRLHGQLAAGLGLGLFLAREIVMAHSGTIDVKSRRRRGTTVTVSLPIGGPVLRPSPDVRKTATP